MDEKAAQWKALIGQWRESGQTQKEFCQDRGIKLSTLHYWMKRIKSSTSDFTPVANLVRIEPKEPAASSSDIVIEIDRRFRISVPDGISAARLREVLEAFR